MLSVHGDGRAQLQTIVGHGVSTARGSTRKADPMHAKHECRTLGCSRQQAPRWLTYSRRAHLLNFCIASTIFCGSAAAPTACMAPVAVAMLWPTLDVAAVVCTGAQDCCREHLLQSLPLLLLRPATCSRAVSRTRLGTACKSLLIADCGLLISTLWCCTIPFFPTSEEITRVR